MPRPKSDLEKIHLRLPKGLAKRLGEIYDAPYTPVIRAILIKFLRNKEEEIAARRAEEVADPTSELNHIMNRVLPNVDVTLADVEAEVDEED